MTNLHIGLLLLIWGRCAQGQIGAPSPPSTGPPTSPPPSPRPKPTPPPLPRFEPPSPSEYRLVNGADDGMGIVEAFHNGTWGILCSDGNFPIESAKVLCGSLGYRSGVYVDDDAFPPAPVTTTLMPPDDKKRPARPAPTLRTAPKIKANFMCFGNETGLDQCPGKWVNYCYYDIAVICSGPSISDRVIEKVRLRQHPEAVNRTELATTGLLEVYHRGRWGFVCDNSNSFRSREVKIFCKHLGYENGYKMVNNLFYFGGTRFTLPWIQNIKCGNDSHNIEDCLNGLYPAEPKDERSQCFTSYNSVTLTCYHSDVEYPLNATDIQDVRLVNTSTDNAEQWITGRIEVKVGGVWGTICDEERYSSQVWSSENANVTCRMLGYGGGMALSSGLFGMENATIWISRIYCRGNESTYTECSGSRNYYGRIDAPSSCRKGGAGVMCYGKDVDAVTKPRKTVQIIGEPDVHTGKVSAGRVEYKFLGLWGPVCHTGWDLREAYVVCTELGFQDGFPLCNSSFGSGSGPNWLNGLRCSGNEADLKDCLQWRETPLSKGPCKLGEQAGVQCVDKKEKVSVSLRIVDKNADDKAEDLIKGVVEVLYKGHWGTICSKNWDDNDARVVCRQLGYADGTALVNQTIGIGTNMVWMNDVECKGDETSLEYCVHEGWATNRCSPACNHMSDAGVHCSSTKKEPTKKKTENELSEVNVSASRSKAGLAVLSPWVKYISIVSLSFLVVVHL